MLVTPESWVPGSPTTLQQRFIDLAALAASGTEIGFVAYNPAVVTTGDPESNATGDGWSQSYKESTANLVEVIYTK